MMAMEGLLFEKLAVIGPEGALFIIAMIPVIEQKGAIILGAAMGLPWWDVLLVAVLGNMVPMPFVLLLGRRVFDWAKKFRVFGKIVARIEKKVASGSEKSQGKFLLGLLCLVTVPIPGTGGWTGSLLSALMGIRLRRSLPVICCGILLGGIIMTLGAYGIVGAFQSFVS